MNIGTSRFPAIAGALFFVLVILGTLIAPTAPDFVAAPEEIAAFFEAEGADLLPTAAMYAVGAAALVWFTGLVAAALRRRGAGDGAALVALAGGAGTAALLAAATSMTAVAGLRVDDAGSIDPALAAALFDIGNILYGFAAPAVASILVLAVAVASIRHGFIPRWLGGLSAVYAVALLLPPISYAAINGLGIWVLIVGIALALEPQTRSSARTSSLESTPA